MKRRFFSLLLAICLVFSLAPTAFAAQVPTYNAAYQAMIALKEEYPEGTAWTNDNRYDWYGYSPQNGVTWGGGYGCVGFAFMLSDAAFGKLPARRIENITIDNVRVGDILRIKEDSHSVIVLEVHDDYVILAEGNYEGTVHWGRKLTAEDVAKADYMFTRYPKDYPHGLELTSWRKAYYDMIQENRKVSAEGTWEMSSYTLIQPKGEAYPALWVDHMIYASGCTMAAIGSMGLNSQLMQYGGLSYIESENLLCYTWGKEGFYDVSIFSILDGKLTPQVSGSYNPYDDICIWNGSETTEAKMDAAIAKLMPPSKTVNAMDNAYSYYEFIDLLYQLEAENGPESPIPTPPVMPEFTDVEPGAYYEEAVNWALYNKITTGKTETTFAPEETCTRGQVVTFLWRYKGEPAPANRKTAFTDVKTDYFYTDAVAWALENKITNGMGDGTFGVEEGCTRGQVVTFLWRTAGCPAPKNSKCEFTDLDASSYYYDAVLWAVENGITNGTSDNTFSPDDTCTRGQIVTFLFRFSN